MSEPPVGTFPDSCLQALSDNGFAWLPRLQPELSTTDVVSLLGRIVHVGNKGGANLLVPSEESEGTRNRYSGNFGLASFPLHTDFAHWYVPPRLFLLRCIRGFESVGTRITESSAFFSTVEESTLRRALFRPRRPVAGRSTLLRCMESFGGAHCVRWDSLFLEPANEMAEALVSQTSTHGAKGVREFFLCHPGDTLLIDNWRCLHGRGPVTGRAKNRVIERAYFSKLTPQ